MIDSSKIDLVKKLIEDKLTTRQIAEALQTSQNFVVRFLKRNGLTTKFSKRGGAKAKIRPNCITCGKTLQKVQAKYCSIDCQIKYQDSAFIQKWLAGGYPFTTTRRDNVRMKKAIRRYLMQESGGKCVKCGFSGINSYSGKTILEIHHIDGKYINNDRSNLELLCPNCHAMTPTHKSLNRGKLNRIKIALSSSG